MSMDIVIFSSSDEDEASPAEESKEKKQQLDIKTDKKIKITTPTASTNARSTATDSNHEAIVKKRVWLLKQNPFEAEYGIRLETYSCFAVQIRQKAAVDGLLEIIDTEWLKKCIGQLTRKEDELKELLSIQNYLLRLAQSSAYEEQMKKKSDRMRILRHYQIRIKVDELDQSLSKIKLEPKQECRDYSHDGRSRRSRKRSFTERDFKLKIKKEENNEDKKPVVKFKTEVEDDDDEEEDRYYRKPFDTSNADIFRDSSPKPEPGIGPFDSEEDSQHHRRHIDIERRPPRLHERPESPEGPTARAQIMQRVFGAHIMPMPANLRRKNGGGDRKKRSTRPKASLSRLDKLARAKTVSANNVYPGMEARSSTSGSGSDDDEEESEDDDDTDRPPIHTTIQVIYNSSSSALPNRWKSCLKRPHRARLVDEHHRRRVVHFAAGIADNAGKTATIPVYVNQITLTRQGQTSTTFTFSMPPVLTSQENVMGQPVKRWAPSSDHAIPIPIRDHPNNFKQADINVHMDEICDQLQDALRIELSWKGNSRLFLMDSLMTRMDKQMFKNMACIELKFPKMPLWFVRALDDWWESRAHGQFFFYTKIFILLGMDLQLYFAHEEGRPEDTIYKFLTALNNWFDNKLGLVQRSLRQQGEDSGHMVYFDMPQTDLQYRPCSVERMLPRLNQKPELVVLTVPEMGSWRPFFVKLNQGLRNFVVENSAHFKLLDWAELLGSMEAREVETVEQRTAVLIRQMHLEHALLYK